MTLDDKDRLLLLISIADDTTKSDDERAEARRRVVAEIAMRNDALTATMLGMEAHLARTFADMLESMKALGEAMDRNTRAMMTELTPLEAAEVCARHTAGEPVLDVIVEVVDRRPA
jgi:CobQ-like glutamine amidotransferase family enzyme